ncbi:MAG: cob(I)yrinic acid a,c-diamide adenosyltransferase [Bacteroidia bacterium]|nr:MAG: cob(I)yrinic acid a,c-diamide adenosyltransferase [Bacteroidia bacterium]
MKAYVQVYTGNGKGKTTAALGLALRAVGNGMRVFIGQFVKGMVYSEIEAIRKYLPGISVKLFGNECFINRKPTQADILAAQNGLEEVKQIIRTKKYDIIILDEINIALYYHLFDTQEVIDLIKSKPLETELILTGRYAPQEIMEIADLVTIMHEQKHYYTKGIEARKGIEF